MKEKREKRKKESIGYILINFISFSDDDDIDLSDVLDDEANKPK